jgi:hypothetical protein
MTAPDQEQGHSALHLAAFLYLLVPLILFLGFFANYLLAIPSLIFLGICCYRLIRPVTWPPIFLPVAASLFVVAAIFTALAGIVPPLYQNSDWDKHYAILKILITNPWPVVITYADQSREVLRYYLGWYLIPASLCKALGLSGIDLAVGAWTILGLGLFFLLLAEILGIERKWSAVAFAVMFMFFSGADVIGQSLTRAPLPAYHHLECWAGWYEYPSNITSLFWTPQHALAGWIAIGLLLNQTIAAQWSVKYAGVLFFSVFFWSPFVAVGIVPFILAAAYQHNPRALLSWPNFLSVLFLAPILFGYMLSDSQGVPKNLIFTTGHGWTWGNLVAFYLLEFGLFAMLLATLGTRRPELLAVTVLTLLAIPLLRMGVYNDFAMRTSVPALGAMAILVAEAFIVHPWRKTLPLLIVFLLGIGTGVGEISRGFVYPRTNPLEVSPEFISSKTGKWQPFHSQYFAPYPNWFLR